jgi:hypothetical protein
MRRSRARGGGESSLRTKIERHWIIFLKPGAELVFHFDRHADGLGPLLAKGLELSFQL